MKTSFSQLTLVGALALLMGIAIPQLNSVEVAVDPGAAPAPLVAAPPLERYLVFDTSLVSVKAPQQAGATLEAILNEHAAQGWRVRATMQPYIIFVQ